MKRMVREFDPKGFERILENQRGRLGEEGYEATHVPLEEGRRPYRS